jgi:hypothetical protein
MNRSSINAVTNPKRFVAAMFLSLLATAVAAAPGAHGPNGEHLDEKTQVASSTSSPRVEAKSELFELVANLKPGELSILVDRYESNEPVLGAQLEVESGSLKAVAAFRPDKGDYVVTDAALLKALAALGEHALVFTLMAGKDSDLLDGTLLVGGTAVAAGDDGHSHDDGLTPDHGLERAAWTGAAVLGLGLLGLVAWLRQRKRDAVVAARGTP